MMMVMIMMCQNGTVPNERENWQSDFSGIFHNNNNGREFPGSVVYKFGCRDDALYLSLKCKENLVTRHCKENLLNGIKTVKLPAFYCSSKAIDQPEPDCTELTVWGSIRRPGLSCLVLISHTDHRLLILQAKQKTDINYANPPE